MTVYLALDEWHSILTPDKEKNREYAIRLISIIIKPNITSVYAYLFILFFSDFFYKQHLGTYFYNNNELCHSVNKLLFFALVCFCFFALIIVCCLKLSYANRGNYTFIIDIYNRLYWVMYILISFPMFQIVGICKISTKKKY